MAAAAEVLERETMGAGLNTEDALELLWALPSAVEPETPQPQHQNVVDLRGTTVSADSAEFGGFFLPNAVRVQDLSEEASVQQEFARGLGSLVFGQTIDTVPCAEASENKVSAMLDSVDQAANGNAATLA